MNSKIMGTILFVFLMVVAVVGMLAYVMQNVLGDITFAEFFDLLMSGELSKK